MLVLPSEYSKSIVSPPSETFAMIEDGVGIERGFLPKKFDGERQGNIGGHGVNELQGFASIVFELFQHPALTTATLIRKDDVVEICVNLGDDCRTGLDLSAGRCCRSQIRPVGRATGGMLGL